MRASARILPFNSSQTLPSKKDEKQQKRRPAVVFHLSNSDKADPLSSRVVDVGVKQLQAQPKRTAEPKRGILKILTHEESLQTQSRHESQSNAFEANAQLDASSTLLDETSSKTNLSTTPSIGVVSNSCSGSSLMESIKSTKVKFHQRHVREYEIIPDSNPSVSKGPGVGLGWKFQEKCPELVHEHEDSRPIPPRSMEKLKLQPDERVEILKAAGASRTEITKAQKQIKVAQVKRRETTATLYTAKREERIENLRIWIKRTMRLKKSESAEQAELWDKANPGEDS